MFCELNCKITFLSCIIEISARQSFQPAFHACNFTWMTHLWKKKTAIDTHLVPPTTSLPANRKCLCLQAIHFPWGDEIPAKFLWTGKHKDTGEMLLHYDHFNARIDFILPFLFHYAVQPKVVSILNPLKPMNYCLLKHCYAKLTISLF